MDDIVFSCKIPPEKKAIIVKLIGNPGTVLRLREMGFAEGSEIKRWNKHEIHGSKCIIVISKNKKYYFDEDIAHSILVRILD